MNNTKHRTQELRSAVVTIRKISKWFGRILLMNLIGAEAGTTHQSPALFRATKTD